LKLSNLIIFTFLVFSLSAFAESIKFTWDKVEGAILYEVEVYPGPELTGRLKIEQLTKPSTKITSGPGQIYVRVRYQDGFSRWSEFSNLSSITIKQKKVPEVVVEEEKPKTEDIKEVVKEPEPQVSVLPEEVIVRAPWDFEGQLIPVYSTFNFTSDSVKRNESLLILMLGLQKKLGTLILGGDFNFTAIDNGVRPNDYGFTLGKSFYQYFTLKAGAGYYTLTSDSNQINSDIKLYYYSLALTFEKELRPNLQLRVSPTIKVGNPLSNYSAQLRAHLAYTPTWLTPDSYIDFFAGYERWTFESDTETLNTTQILSGIGYIKQF
jgi:hypothetical protein